MEGGGSRASSIVLGPASDMLRHPMELPASTTQLTLEDGRELYLVGTAHVSARSVADVRQVIEAVEPDTVCVELDSMRLQALEDPSHWRKLDIFQVIKQQKVLYLFANLSLSAFQRRLGNKLGVQPGAEMREAVKLARERHAELVLADRPIQATLKRSWAALSLGQRFQTLSVLLGGLFQRQELTEDDIESLKEKDAINEAMQEFAKALPSIKTPLIDERDRYLMSKVEEAPGQRIVAVVGAAHVQGMLAHQGEAVDRDALEVIPEPSVLWRMAKWVIPTLVLAAFYWGYHKHSDEGLRDMLVAWIVPNAVVAGLLATLAGARPLTILVSFFGSPITSLNPTVGVGLFAGLCEAWQRRPTVEDCEGVPDAMLSLRGIYGNRFTRVLLVAVAASVGSSLGAFIGTTWIATLI